MKNKTKMNIVALTGSLIMLTGCNVVKGGERVNIDELNQSIQEINESPKYQFYYYNDTVDADKEVEELGITDDTLLSYDSYKPFQYIDMNGLERIAITTGQVNYITDENGNVIGKTFTYFDAFDGTELLTTTDDMGDHVHKRIENFESDEVFYIMDQGDNLLDLRDMVVSKGLTEEYALVIMPDIIEGSRLTRSQVGRMYVLLVNSHNRPSHNNQITRELN